MDLNHRMELQYEGTGFHGWAKQPGLPTIESSVEVALATILGRAPSLRVAGRTDAGVHARRQVISLSLPGGLDLNRLAYSLNALTPSNIAVTSIAAASADFDARSSAVSRTYRYFLSTAAVVSPYLSGYCWQVGAGVDLGALVQTAQAVVGRHDFSAFTPAKTEHVSFERRVVACAWDQLSGRESALVGDHLVYLEIEAESFLRHMVRSLVGTMLEVAQGKRSNEEFVLLLRGASRELSGTTAPAKGLFLWDVGY